MTASALTALVLSWLVVEVPPVDASKHQYVTARETTADRIERYQSIAADVAAVVEDEMPPSDRRWAAAMLVAVAIRESGLARDVDLGPCDPARTSRGGCDRGRAVSLWQIQGVPVADRQDAARTAWRMMVRSASACRRLPLDERLAAYAAGHCASTAGRRLSRDRYALARRLLARTVPAS